MMYKVMKCDIATERWYDYGVYTEDEAKQIVRGYRYNGLFFEKKNSNTIYTVEKA